MTDSGNNVVRLPNDFIGKAEEVKLESFGAHLIAHGAATRWHWRRSNGFDVEFEVFRGGSDEELLVRISRDKSRSTFHAVDASGGRVAQGSLEHVMTVVDSIARSDRPEPPA